LKLYGSETSTQNGTAPHPDEDPEVEELAEEFDYSQLFDAPSYSEFIKTAPSSHARSYERRVQSMMKAGMVMSLNNHQYPDAATFLKHGPGFAKAAGNLAAVDAKAAAIVDMLTAPDSPYVMFAMVALPFVGQLVRNHQVEVKEAASTFRERRAERKQARLMGTTTKTKPEPVTVHLGKLKFKLPFRLRLKLPFTSAFKALLAPTQYPDEIAAEVFNDPSVVKALHKMGIYPRQADHDEAA
jgi:hypothetical protein